MKKKKNKPFAHAVSDVMLSLLLYNRPPFLYCVQRWKIRWSIIELYIGCMVREWLYWLFFFFFIGGRFDPYFSFSISFRVVEIEIDLETFAALILSLIVLFGRLFITKWKLIITDVKPLSHQWFTAVKSVKSAVTAV